jgi:hypothetical protein
MIDVCPVGALTDKNLDSNLEFGSTNLTTLMKLRLSRDVVGKKTTLDVWRQS